MSVAAATEFEGTFLDIVRNEPLIFKSRMPKERFHHFVLKNSELKIERDKNGIITIHPLMTFDSGFDEGEAFFHLKLWSKKDKTGKAFSPTTSFDLPDGSQYKADGAWISNEKIKQLTEAERKSIASIVPDFVMEVRSESDRISKLKKKMKDAWMENGVQLAWLIDPKTEKVWIYRQDGSEEEVVGFDKVLSGENVLPGFEFDLREMKG